MTDLDRLQELFAKLKIDTGSPGFYDDPHFIQQEKADANFLETYARFVELRPYETEYLQRVRCELPLIFETFRREVATAGADGACIDASNVLSRMLDREGIWNYGVKGSVTIHFSKTSGIPPLYFWSYDIHPESRPVGAAHAWIVAPPFRVVDLTIKYQPYERGRDMLPEGVLAENADLAAADFKDMFSEEYLEQRGLPYMFILAAKMSSADVIKALVPRLIEFQEFFHASSIECPAVRLKYVPIAIGAPAEGLEGITNRRYNGRFGFEIYRDLIVSEIKRSRDGASSSLR